MKDWSDLEERYQDMRAEDPAQAEDFKKQMTERLKNHHIYHHHHDHHHHHHYHHDHDHDAGSRRQCRLWRRRVRRRKDNCLPCTSRGSSLGECDDDDDDLEVDDDDRDIDDDDEDAGDTST